jgi:acyl dehydratase
MAAVFDHVTGVTPGMLDEARSMIGQDLRIEQYNHEASFDTIRRYAFGIGDDNPLWCDEEYASTGPYRTMVASPTWFYSVFAPGIAPGLSGLQPIHAGGSWTIERYARRGERVKASARLLDVEELKGRRADTLIVQTGEVLYQTTDGELLATVRSQSFRIPRRDAPGGLTYKPKPQRRYTSEELKNIEDDIFAEERRGTNPRYFEDVELGDQLVPVIKGPLDQISMTCYYAGAIGTSGYKACELRWKQWRMARRTPELMSNNYDITYYSESTLPSLGHQDDKVAQAIGMPGAYDNGPQRIGWMSHLVTNWAGDRGFVKNLVVRVRRPNIFGDTTWCQGKVTGKRIDGGARLADLEIWADNQDGERNTEGSATVVLPARGDQ